MPSLESVSITDYIYPGKRDLCIPRDCFGQDKEVSYTWSTVTCVFSIIRDLNGLIDEMLKSLLRRGNLQDANSPSNSKYVVVE